MSTSMWSKAMKTRPISRRDVLLQGSLAVAGLALLRLPGLAEAFSIQPGENVLPWLDQPASNPVPEVIGNQLQWEKLDNWVTPNDQFSQSPVTTSRFSMRDLATSRCA